MVETRRYEVEIARAGSFATNDVEGEPEFPVEITVDALKRLVADTKLPAPFRNDETGEKIGEIVEMRMSDDGQAVIGIVHMTWDPFGELLGG